ncbi:prostaglandin F2-alpha receptor-like [Anneissia japonica]|uniref:prostaglandin F2-alpha receptor-like n=1 Tax=Anneissia japonica TaxID=1529436 RepID=UPI00142564FA|nr:prostaglandin F2-alpha receptor-like [Anneissia japonica]
MDKNYTFEFEGDGGNNNSHNILSAIILAAGFIANLVAVVFLYKHLQKHKEANHIILLFTLIMVDFICIALYILRRILRNFVSCNLFGFTNYLFPLASGSMSSLMCFERCISLSMPYRYGNYFQPKKTKFYAVAILGLMVCVSALPFVGVGSYDKIFFGPVSFCKNFYIPSDPAIYNVHFALYSLCGWSIVVIGAVSNIRVVYAIYAMTKMHAAVNLNQAPQLRNKEIKRQTNIAKTVIAIFTGFTICWVPWLVVLIILRAGKLVNNDIIIVTSQMLLANHLVDPISWVLTSPGIYKVISTKLRVLLPCFQRSSVSVGPFETTNTQIAI